jgi:hypothetical protein
MLPVPFTKITFLKGEQSKNKVIAEKGHGSREGDSDRVSISLTETVTDLTIPRDAQ